MTSWKPPTSHFGLQKASASHPQTLGPVWAGARQSSQLHPPAAIRKDPVPPGGNQSKSPTAQAGEGRVALPLVGVLGTEPDALPGLCGPSTRLGVAQAAQPSPVFLESTIPPEPRTMGSHGLLWSITTPLTLTAWLWLPEDAQVPTMPTGFSEAVGLSCGHTMMLYSGSVLFSLPGGRGSGLNPPADPPPWAALRSSPSSTFPDSALCPGPFTGPVAGRTEGFSILAVSPHPDPQGCPRELAPLYPSSLCPSCPALAPQPGTAGAHPVPPLHPSQACARWVPPPPAQGKRFPGAADATESAGRSPGPSPSGAADGGGVAGADVRGWPSRASRTRTPRLHAPLPDQRARPLPSQPGRPGARPYAGGSAPPRPAPPGGPFI